jgi:heme exporter protein D
MSTQTDTPLRRWVRIFIVAVVAATCARVWLGSGVALPQAMAQIPDSGLQRKEMLDEIRRTNRWLEQIHQTLQTETIKVRMEGTDKTSGKAAVPPPEKS